MSWKTSPLLISQVLGLFGNRFTADRMYSRHRWEKIPQQIQALLSQKPRTFSRIFIEFLEATQNFSHFEKNDQLHSLNISEIIEPDKCGYFNVLKLLS